jgi:phosphinothricin acetyltransferase
MVGSGVPKVPYLEGGKTVKPAIRPAREDDVPDLTRIINQAILGTTAIFESQSRSEADQLAWFRRHTPPYSVLVAEAEGRVIGWASLSEWQPRDGYRLTAESSLFVDAECRGRGIGRQLKEALVEEARRQGLHVLIAQVAADNAAAMQLNQAVGYRFVGTLTEVGHTHGRYRDVHILQLTL